MGVLRMNGLLETKDQGANSVLGTNGGCTEDERFTGDERSRGKQCPGDERCTGDEGSRDERCTGEE